MTLTRLTPGPPTFQVVLGVELALDGVGAYHQPATGSVLVRKAP